MFKDRKILVGLIFVVYSMLLVKWIMCVEREKGVGVRKKKMEKVIIIEILYLKCIDIE